MKEAESEQSANKPVGAHQPPDVSVGLGGPLKVLVLNRLGIWVGVSFGFLGSFPLGFLLPPPPPCLPPFFVLCRGTTPVFPPPLPVFGNGVRFLLNRSWETTTAKPVVERQRSVEVPERRVLLSPGAAAAIQVLNPVVSAAVGTGMPEAMGLALALLLLRHVAVEPC